MQDSGRLDGAGMNIVVNNLFIMSPHLDGADHYGPSERLSRRRLNGH